MVEFAHYPSLSGKVAFVTGGATGIGAEMVSAFAKQNCKVGFVDIQEGAATELSHKLRLEGATVWFCKTDVTDVEALKKAISDCEAALGPIDVLVNNAANDTRQSWQEVTSFSWDVTMNVNLRPAFFSIQAVASAMKHRGHGSIINFGSISWKAKHGGMPVYVTAKAAIHGLTRSFVNELGSSGVRINTVLPGWVLTERQLNEHWDNSSASTLDQNQALKGRIQPCDTAALVMFLASDDSRMCTGQEFTVDGGWT
ncbi:SDR family oxidoreductase [Cognatishimia sp. WU-CL00825]|uniref:SDR family NAD(P)-dependent oxidoreductase n=1 Tax=Cognatishimia sp. WU-CL00825 TaxID=3127658 RepID=UPI00310A590B